MFGCSPQVITLQQRLRVCLCCMKAEHTTGAVRSAFKRSSPCYCLHSFHHGTHWWAHHVCIKVASDRGWRTWTGQYYLSLWLFSAFSMAETCYGHSHGLQRSHSMPTLIGPSTCLHAPNLSVLLIPDPRPTIQDIHQCLWVYIRSYLGPILFPKWII